jgi:hypothetical protein
MSSVRWRSLTKLWGLRKTLARNTAIVLEELECWKEAQVLREKYGIGNEGAS